MRQAQSIGAPGALEVWAMDTRVTVREDEMEAFYREQETPWLREMAENFRADLARHLRADEREAAEFCLGRLAIINGILQRRRGQ
jgi:hypothetical protein